MENPILPENPLSLNGKTPEEKSRKSAAELKAIASTEKASSEVERFALFRFNNSLGKGFKSRIKSLGCIWNSLCHGWLCPLDKQAEVKKAIQEAGLECEPQIMPFPKGIIPRDSKIANRQTQLDILEEKIYKEERALLVDVHAYEPSLRPEDFAEPPTLEGKSPPQIEIENEFHERWLRLQEDNKAAQRLREELSHLSSDQGDKIFEPGAPLLIADAMIKKCFLWGEVHRTLHYCSNTFWQWNGVRYVELSEGGMRQKVYDFLRDAKEMGKQGCLDNFNPTQYKVDQVIDALQAVCYLDHDPYSGAIWLDGREGPDPHYLISFPNGLLNVMEWLESPNAALMPQTPSLMNVNTLAFSYDPSAQEPREWLDFISSLWLGDEESQQTLQEWMGYFLIHDTRLHKILLIIGPPRSGKGTIGRCLTELLGSFNVIGPTLSSLGGEFGLQPFLNKMLALIADARLSGKSNSTIIERLLSISGEDSLTVNRKFLPPLTVQLHTKLVIMSNEIPDMRDASGALAKRYSVLALTKSWLGKEDTSLFSKLKAELPGILLWALRGLARLQKRGRFLQPASSMQMIEELEAMTSPIRAFVADRCEFKPQGDIPADTLFKAWQQWCEETGYTHAGNVQSFGKNLRAAFPDIETIRPQKGSVRERCYKGIVLTAI